MESSKDGDDINDERDGVPEVHRQTEEQETELDDVGDNHSQEDSGLEPTGSLAANLAYGDRPTFLDLSSQELQKSKDHEVRPIVSPSDGSQFSWNSGYAEVINAGKSFQRNEDQASFFHEVIRYKDNYQSEVLVSIPVWFFGVFDGHAGDGAAFYSARYCHKYFIFNLHSIRQFLAHPDWPIQPQEDSSDFNDFPSIHLKDLIRGALEATFFDTDNRIKVNHLKLTDVGGCTALVSVFVNQTLYIANAGDCRAVIVRAGQIVEMSSDFTPETDRQRIQAIAHMQPHLLGDRYRRLQFERLVDKNDVGDKILYRDYNMTGWAYRVVEEEDVRRPMIIGQEKAARLLATISTTRGFGDHDLTSNVGDLLLKPFLTPTPEIRLYDLTDHESLSYDDVLILASDGLWEILTNEEARDLVQRVFMELPAEDRSRYMTAARNLVQAARGKLTITGWKTEQNQEASGDDITCFVIPLKKAAQEMSSPVLQQEKPTPSHTQDTDKDIPNEDDQRQKNVNEANACET